jgi:hypothetical protein
MRFDFPGYITLLLGRIQGHRNVSNPNPQIVILIKT